MNLLRLCDIRQKMRENTATTDEIAEFREYKKAESARERSDYCTQNYGDCGTCSLVNYGRDCHNNPVARNVSGGYCNDCGRPVIYCRHTANHLAASTARLAACQSADPDRIDPADVAAFFGDC